MATAGDLVANLRVNHSQFKSDLAGARNSVKSLAGDVARLKFQDNAAKSLTSAIGIGAGGSFLVALGQLGSKSTAAVAAVTGLAVAVGALVAKSVQAAREQLQVEKRLRGVLAANRNVAGLSFEDISSFANSRPTNFDDAETLGAAVELATLTNIRGDQFIEALSLAQDLAAVFGEDLKSSASELGKALNNPASGLKSLVKSGVVSSAEAERIKGLQAGGDIGGAQRAILKAIGDRGVRGAAETNADSFTQLGNAFGDMFDAAGFLFLPTMTALADAARAAIEPFAALRDTLTNLGITIVDTAKEFVRFNREMAKFVGIKIGPLDALRITIKGLGSVLDTFSFAMRNHRDAFVLFMSDSMLAIDRGLGAVLTAIRNFAFDFVDTLTFAATSIVQHINQMFGGALPAGVMEIVDTLNKNAVARLSRAEKNEGIKGVLPDGTRNGIAQLGLDARLRIAAREFQHALSKNSFLGGLFKGLGRSGDDGEDGGKTKSEVPAALRGTAEEYRAIRAALRAQGEGGLLVPVKQIAESGKQSEYKLGKIIAIINPLLSPIRSLSSFRAPVDTFQDPDIVNFT